MSRSSLKCRPLPSGPVVALVEDDPVMGQSVMDWLEVEGYRSVWYRNGAEALSGLGRSLPDALVCDLRLPDITGEEVVRSLGARLGGVPVVFITGFGDVGQAVRLMRAGAADYVTKPFEIEDLLARIESLLATRVPQGAEASLGIAPAIVSVERVLRRVAKIDSNVLITGPSGSGKEVAARLLHSEGRPSQRFMAVNCAAIPADLLESEIFGHEKGAFTGAAIRREGLAEAAGTGTLFLDEVTELPLALQAKLLRLLQERVFRHVGGDRDIPLRARVVAATNADIEALVRAGRFRQDLLFRLSVIAIDMPPLKERRDDILPLARQFLTHYTTAFGRPVRALSTLAEHELLAHDYPGNVRELRNRIERAVALADGAVIGPADLFPERTTGAVATGPAMTLSDVRDAAERLAITTALSATGGDVAAAAERLQVSRSTLFEKIRRLGIRSA